MTVFRVGWTYTKHPRINHTPEQLASLSVFARCSPLSAFLKSCQVHSQLPKPSTSCCDGGPPLHIIGSLDNDELLRAMLHLRKTPDLNCNVSSAEVIIGRPITDAFSIVNRCRPTKFEAGYNWLAKEKAMRARFARTSETLNTHSRAAKRALSRW